MKKSMVHYQTLFIQKKSSEIGDFLGRSKVSENELYTFFHTVKGTAGSFELWEWMQAAQELEQKVKPNSNKDWNQEAVRTLLEPLLRLLKGSAYSSFSVDIIEDPTPSRLGQHGMVLLIDDDIELLTYLRDLLEEEQIMTVTATEFTNDTVAKLYSWLPECVILDVNMPGADGFSVLSKIQEHCSVNQVPILMTSASVDQKMKHKCYSLADDFIQKPIVDPQEFVIRVKKHIGKRKRITALMLIDELTGLFNQRYAHLELTRQLQDLKRSHEPFSLALIDLDNFAELNHMYGYQVGDQILRNFSHFMRVSIRPTDQFARESADAFVLILPRTRQMQAVQLLERVLNDYRNLQKNPMLDKAVTFSASVAEITNAELTVEQCLSILSFNEKMKENTAMINEAAFDQPSMRKLCIAIIDDDSLIRELLIEQLQDIGDGEMNIEIKSFEDGQAFLSDEWHQQHRYYFLIVDRVMPKMDGIALLHTIRESYEKRKYTVMMLTSRDS